MNLIFLGDSLMQPNDDSTFPQQGWPQGLTPYLKDPKATPILDFALNGRSTKSFLAEGRFDEALLACHPGDYCLISFGHNDEKIKDRTRYTAPYGSYEKNLGAMAYDLLVRGVTPIFLSSISRLIYDDKGVLEHTHGDYPKAMQTLAQQIHAPFIDLEKLTYEDLSRHTKAENEKHYMVLPPDFYPNYPDGNKDTSHLSANGALWICQMVVPYLRLIPGFATILKEKGDPTCPSN
ncbi:MAG: GDSL-type esterase/lipase family protein [Bacilli bacterium]|jgi:lysophospholipase L1-like esterase|nr:GDSL-type esterase/lipase family protein [Bacilli bacterium]